MNAVVLLLELYIRFLDETGHTVRFWASQVALVVTNAADNAGDARDGGLIPELGRSPGVGSGNHSNILAWEIPWTEELGGLQSMGPQRRKHD